MPSFGCIESLCYLLARMEVVCCCDVFGMGCHGRITFVPCLKCICRWSYVCEREAIVGGNFLVPG